MLLHVYHIAADGKKYAYDKQCTAEQIRNLHRHFKEVNGEWPILEQLHRWEFRMIVCDKE